MKAPKQHSWMDPGWSSSDPQPRPYGWAYGEDQGDHHVLEFRKDRSGHRETSSLGQVYAKLDVMNAMGLRNMSVPMLQRILEDQAKDRAARRRVEETLAMRPMPEEMLQRAILDTYSQNPDLRRRAIDMFAAVGEGVFRGMGWRR